MITENSVWNTKTQQYIIEHDASRFDPSRKYVIDFMKREGIKNVLECGIGSGIFLDNLQEIEDNISYTGIDASKKFIGYVRKKYAKANIVEWDCDERLPFADNQFQLVYARHFLEHVKSCEIIKEMARVAQEYVVIVMFRPLLHEAVIKFREHKGTYYNSYSQDYVFKMCKGVCREYEYFEIDGNEHSPSKSGKNWILHLSL